MQALDENIRKDKKKAKVGAHSRLCCSLCPLCRRCIDSSLFRLPWRSCVCSEEKNINLNMFMSMVVIIATIAIIISVSSSILLVRMNFIAVFCSCVLCNWINANRCQLYVVMTIISYSCNGPGTATAPMSGKDESVSKEDATGSSALYAHDGPALSLLQLRFGCSVRQNRDIANKTLFCPT